MKNILFTFLLINFAFSMEIIKTVTLEESLETNNYKIFINVSKEAKEKNSIEIDFERAIDYAKDSKVCKGGKYNIHPRYSYHNNKRKFIGYNGNISFDCTFHDETIIEEFLSDLERIENLQISQGRINPTLTDEQKQLLKEKLEIKVFQYAKEYISFLDDKVDLECKVSHVEFLSATNHYPMVRVAKANVTYDDESANITKPIDATDKKTLRVQYKFACKN